MSRRPARGLAARFAAGAALFAATSTCAPVTPGPPPILLVTLDTTRPDHLSVYGYGRRTTPHLEELAGESVLYTRAWSTSSWTLPAHASLFTGLFPAAHGAHFDARDDANGAARPEAGPAAHPGPARASALDTRFTTLAEILAEHGYATGAVVAGPWLKRGFGLLQGFEYVEDRVGGFAGRRGDRVTELALAWLDRTGPERPVFLFLNYFDPHAPYDPPEGFDDYPGARDPFQPGPRWHDAEAGANPFDERELAVLRARYDGEIRAMDAALGRVLESFQARPGGERALVVVTSDHGESFGEGGRFLHNTFLSEEQVRIPLLVRYPDRRGAGTRSDAIVQLPDLFSLVLREAGIEPPEGAQGVPPGERQHAFADLYRNPRHVERHGARYDRRLESVVEWPWKLVVSDAGDARVVRVDGAQEAPADPGADVARRLADLLGAHRDRVGRARGAQIQIDADTLESLRALGYLD